MLWCILFPAIYTLSKVLVPYESDKKSFEKFVNYTSSMFTVKYGERDVDDNRIPSSSESRPSSVVKSATRPSEIMLTVRPSSTFLHGTAAIDSSNFRMSEMSNSGDRLSDISISSASDAYAKRSSDVETSDIQKLEAPVAAAPLNLANYRENLPVSVQLNIPRMSTSNLEDASDFGNASDDEPDKKNSAKVSLYKFSSRAVKYTSYFAADLWFLYLSSVCLNLLRMGLNFEAKNPKQPIMSLSFAERTEEERKLWKTRREEFFPPYKDLCKEVYRDLSRRFRRVLGMVSHRDKKKSLTIVEFILEMFVFFISYTGIGHFATITGRNKWIIVIRKYAIFFCVCLGIWTDEFFESYGLNKYVDPSDEYYIGNVNSVGATADSGKENMQSTFTYLLEGIICTRAVLLQTYATITPLSLFAIGKQQELSINKSKTA